MQNRIVVYKHTSDSWYPEYQLTTPSYNSKNKLVQVTYHSNIAPPSHDCEFRVSAWGDDDFGMEFDTKSENEAWLKFIAVIGLTDVTHEALVKLGFIPA